MKSFCSFVYESTAEDYIGRNKRETNKSIYKCYKDTFVTLSRHLNESLYNKLQREGVDFRTITNNNNNNNNNNTNTNNNVNERILIVHRCIQ